ncbi:hypothetical protein T440DRAFT_507634 [Plenodomus tracheiphilus IPT5]|uniref:Ubiquitin 3 binding protein But2 C-terminal domain-containing protein n=1 Tax=Plenodomus tracheiphilus IPT5 TaxID=1408161 RepID=A0A6A7B5Y1_9PLEO|nr:hypothetical protein T440DRAFT_507634 [Plenodomus tracheiphilus IPT5]
MHISTPFLTGLSTLALTPLTSSTPLYPDQHPLKDFLVSSVSIYTPSGLPGSYPWASIKASITNPNAINLGNASTDGHPIVVAAGSQGLNCQATYFTDPPVPENPLNRTFPCDPIENGYWTMRILPNPASSNTPPPSSDSASPPTQIFSSSSLRLHFTHTTTLVYQGTLYTATYEAEGGFEVGRELSGMCGASGVCRWGLAGGLAPVRVVGWRV